MTLVVFNAWLIRWRWKVWVLSCDYVLHPLDRLMLGCLSLISIASLVLRFELFVTVARTFALKIGSLLIFSPGWCFLMWSPHGVSAVRFLACIWCSPILVLIALCVSPTYSSEHSLHFRMYTAPLRSQNRSSTPTLHDIQSSLGFPRDFFRWFCCSTNLWWTSHFRDLGSSADLTSACFKLFRNLGVNHSKRDLWSPD